MSAPRVLEIITGIGVEPPLGGAERFGIQLSRALQPIGEIVPVVCGLWSYGTASEAEWCEVLTNEGISTVSGAPWDAAAPFASLRRSASALATYLRQHPVDIVHSHVPYGDLVALYLKFTGIPRVTLRTLHNPREWINRPYLRLAFSQFFYPLLLDREAGVSQQVVDHLNRRPIARLTGKHARCLYNAVEVDRYRRAPRIDTAAKKAALGLPADAVVVGSVGRLVDQKDYRTLLSAAALTLKTNPRLHFLIAGDGPQRAALEEQAAGLGIASRILFAGPRQDVDELFQVMDLFVSSSLWEGLPTVVLEAMAAGVPIVATDIPGTRELVQPGISGWLVPPADPPALAAAILEALDSPERRAAFIRQAAANVDRFSIDRVAAEYTELYLHLLRGKTGSSTSS